MRPHLFVMALTLVAGAIVGCAETDHSNSPAATASPASANPALLSAGSAGRPAHAQCLVCKKNADLACIDVAVDPATPTYAFEGQTYYFCSTECRDKFARNPGKYVGK